jgi:hypothetical protein
MSDTVKITTTMQPKREYQVSTQEATDLARRGFLATRDGRKVAPDKAVEKVAAKDSGQPNG